MFGRTLGHYRIVDRLGSGGMGVVWLAEDLKLGRKVALKVLREDLAGSPEKAARFEREARAIAALSHPSIVTLHAVEEIDGVRFLAMEYLEGRTLDQLVREGPLPVAEIVRIALPIAAALEAAHARGILHRDLKPSNVMVCADGRVKVLDFGLAKLLEDPAKPLEGPNETTLTREGQVVGTLHYSSPEQLRQEAVDARTDIYSLGAVLYEMATGRVPFQGDSAAQVITAVLCDVPRRIDELDEGFPGELAKLVAKCLVKDAMGRPSTVSSIRRSLEQSAGVVDSLLRPSISSVKRDRSTSVARLMVVAPAILTLTAALWWMSRSRPAENEAVAATSSAPRRADPTLSLVVLPAKGGVRVPEHVLDGVTDGVIGTLGRRHDLRVISRQSAMHFKRSEFGVRKIAEDLDVQVVIEIEVNYDRDQVQGRVQLHRIDTGEIDAESSVRSARLDELHQVLADRIAEKLELETTRLSKESRRSSSIDPRAYEEFLLGKYHLMRFDSDSRRRAESHFRAALAIDEEFAAAWASLGEVLILRAHSENRERSFREEAEAAAERALSLDPDLATGHALRGQLHQERFAWRDAEESLRRAILLEPNSAFARRRKWLFLAARLRLEEARAAIRAAHRLDPLSPMIGSDVALQHCFDGEYERALEVLDAVLALDPSYVPAYGYEFIANLELGRHREGAESLRRYLFGLGFAHRLGELDRRLSSSGLQGALRWVARGLAEDPEILSRFPGLPAGLLAQAGLADDALTILELGAAARSWELNWLAVDPSYRSLHGHPRFDRILRELGLPLPQSIPRPRR